MNSLLEIKSLFVYLKLNASDCPVLFSSDTVILHSVLKEKSGSWMLPSVCFSEQKLGVEIEGLATSEKQICFIKERV